MSNIYPRDPDPTEERVLEAFRQLVSPSERLEITPNIHASRLEGAKSTYLTPQEDELLIAIYDSTGFMRHAKDGVAFTTKRLYWRESPFDGASVRAYTDLPARLRWDGDHLQVGDDSPSASSKPRMTKPSVRQSSPSSNARQRSAGTQR